MTIRPILFSGPMVRALLEGRKTQTRRVLIKLRRFGKVSEFGPSDTKGYDWHFRDKEMRWHDLRDEELKQALPYHAGGLLYVREAFTIVDDNREFGMETKGTEKERLVHFVQDGGYDCEHLDVSWKPSIHMPRWASRITLKVTDVRIQRLQEISRDDALAEGIERQDPTPEDWEWYRSWAEENGHDPEDPEGVGPVWIAPGTWNGYGPRENSPHWGPTPESAFRFLWDSINGKRAGGFYKWFANPWVVATTFEVIKANVDSLPREKAA